MATRFYMYPNAGTPAAPVSPSYSATWEQTGEAGRCALIRKSLNILAVNNNPNFTVPITTTQDILARQYTSEPIRAQTISGTVSLVARFSENDLGCNATLALVINLVSQDGGTVRGNLFTNMSNDTEFPVSAATRIVNAQSLTSQVAQDGDRIVVEVGANAAAPTVSGTYQPVFTTSGTDFALTSGLTGGSNSWIEFSQDLFPALPNNYQSITDSGGNTGILAFTERVR